MAYRDPGIRWTWLRRRRAFPPLRAGFFVVVGATLGIGLTALAVVVREAFQPGPALLVALGVLAWSAVFLAVVAQETFAWVDVHDRGLELVRPLSRRRVAFDDVVALRAETSESRTWVDRTLVLVLKGGGKVALHGGQIDETTDLAPILDRGLRR